MRKTPVYFSISAVLYITVFFSSAHAVSVQSDVLYSGITSSVIPILHGYKVLYQYKPSGTYRLYIVDLAGTNEEVRDNLTKYLWPLDFSGTHAAWITYSGGSGGIPIGGGGGGIGDPGQIPGSGAAYKVELMDIDTKNETKITNDTTYKDFLSMDEQAVIWTDYRHSTASDTFNEIYYSPLNNPSPGRITSTVSYKASVDIHGGKMVWQDYRNAGGGSNADIYFR
ncbi:MAG: hypothetical protein GF350_07955, partial [Chitinivibrionales bacterium]|nr:hypothetical protein [Chitinivibrionales bacterium]